MTVGIQASIQTACILVLMNTRPHLKRLCTPTVRPRYDVLRSAKYRVTLSYARYADVVALARFGSTLCDLARQRSYVSSSKDQTANNGGITPSRGLTVRGAPERVGRDRQCAIQAAWRHGL